MLLTDTIVVYLHTDKQEQVKVIQCSDMDQIELIIIYKGIVPMFCEEIF